MGGFNLMENKDRGYFFIDGSHLMSSINTLWRKKLDFKDKKLSIKLLSNALMQEWSYYIGSTVRITYYFKKDEKRIKTMLTIPDICKPGEKDHWQIKECGQNIRGTIPDDALQKLPPKYRDYFPRAEKGLDIQLACDALSLVATGKTSNIVFLVNDGDYIPLFETVQQLGGNVYLTALDSSQNIHKNLVNLADKYLTLDRRLKNIFNISKTNETKGQQVIE